jgi:hypothetical protein
MALATLRSPASDFETHLRRCLPGSNDLGLIILTGHLLLEEEIDGLIFENLANPAALQQAGLSFPQRLCLARALAIPDDLDLLLDIAQRLTDLRDHVASPAEHPQLERHLEEFLCLVEDPEASLDDHERGTMSARLQRAIVFLCAELSGWRDVYAARNSLIPTQSRAAG